MADFITDTQLNGYKDAINKKSNQMFRTDDIEVLTNIASHVALNIEGEGSSIRKILHFSRTQQQAVRQSSDYTRTATLQQVSMRGGMEEEFEDISDRQEEDDPRAMRAFAGKSVQGGRGRKKAGDTADAKAEFMQEIHAGSNPYSNEFHQSAPSETVKRPQNDGGAAAKKAEDPRKRITRTPPTGIVS